MSHNEALAALFREMAIMLEILEDNGYRARAYSRASTSIEKLNLDICDIATKGDLQQIPGIGKTLARQIKTWCRQGTFEEYEKLKRRFPEELFVLLKIPGLGPRKVKVLYQSLGITSLGELEYACLENRLVELKGFGTKTQEKILKNIETVKVYATYRRAPEAYEIARFIESELKKVFSKVELVGGLRRFQEIAEDADFLVYGDAESLEKFISTPLLKRAEHLSNNRITGYFDGFKIDIRVVKASSDITPLLYYTGSKIHVEKLVKIAHSKDLVLTDREVRKNGKVISFRHEGDLYNELGMSYIPPELREGLEEIEAAMKHELPKLVNHSDIAGIFHIHTSASDGSLALEDVVKKAIELGYQYIGISDHSKSAFYAGGLDEDALTKQFEEIQRLREQYAQIDIYWGIESDILADGSLDYSDDILEKFDFVIGSVHSGLKMDKVSMMKRLLKALRNPFLTILGHPTGRLLLGREPYDVDMERLLDEAARNSKIIELNAHPHRLDLDWRWCIEAKQRGIPISINPDAHKIGDFDLTFGIMTARKGWLEPKDVWNARNREDMRALMKSKPWMR